MAITNELRQAAEEVRVSGVNENSSPQHIRAAFEQREWVAVYEHEQYGKSKVVYLNPTALAEDMAHKTATGSVVRSVAQRERRKFNERDFPELYR